MAEPIPIRPVKRAKRVPKQMTREIESKLYDMAHTLSLYQIIDLLHLMHWPEELQYLEKPIDEWLVHRPDHWGHQQPTRSAALLPVFVLKEVVMVRELLSLGLVRRPKSGFLRLTTLGRWMVELLESLLVVKPPASLAAPPTPQPPAAP